jgi:hypothetical protein
MVDRELPDHRTPLLRSEWYFFHRIWDSLLAHNAQHNSDAHAHIAGRQAIDQKFDAVLTGPGLWYWSRVDLNGFELLAELDFSLIELFGS